MELKRHSLVHRDIKLPNILINHNFEVKLCDFGFVGTRLGADLMVSFAGTPITMAPEILDSMEYDEKCDMWSLGCVIY